MHAARVLNRQRGNREHQRRLQILSLASPATPGQSQKPGESFSSENTLYIDRLEERRKSIAIERERSHLNLFHVGLILILIGTVMFVIGYLVEDYTLLEVGLVAVLLGLYGVIGCGCHSKKGGDVYHHRDIETAETTLSPTDVLLDTQIQVRHPQRMETSYEYVNEVRDMDVNAKETIQQRPIACSPSFPMIPEEPESVNLPEDSQLQPQEIVNTTPLNENTFSGTKNFTGRENSEIYPS